MKPILFLIIFSIICFQGVIAQNSSQPYKGKLTRDQLIDSVKSADSLEKAMNYYGTGVMVGGDLMIKSRDIFENLSHSADHTTLVAAIKYIGLVEVLEGTGPFTMFVAANEAFDKIDKKTLEDLMSDTIKADLTKILVYHIVPGVLHTADLKDSLEFTTVERGRIKVIIKDGIAQLEDENGRVARIIIADVPCKNGIIHVIDTVLIPKMTKPGKKTGKKHKGNKE